MDGDAWGSLWGLTLVLKEMWKEVIGINDSWVPESLRFLGHNDIINPDLDVEQFNPDLIISLDASDTGRLWEVYTKWKHVFDNKMLIVIDHHISNPGFWKINIIDPAASSVCELLTIIIENLGLEEYVTPEAATFLYTGLQTDSNMYFNTNTRPSTLRAWALLMELWADFRLPVTQLYKKRTQEQLKFWAYAFEKIEYHFHWSVCSCVLTQEWIESLGWDYESTSWYFKWFISELLINIEGIKIAFLIYPLNEWNNKVSMRSQKWYNVAEICESFAGGGHIQAAGFDSSDSSEVITKSLLEITKKLV